MSQSMHYQRTVKLVCFSFFAFRFLLFDIGTEAEYRILTFDFRTEAEYRILTFGNLFRHSN